MRSNPEEDPASGGAAFGAFNGKRPDPVKNKATSKKHRVLGHAGLRKTL